MTVEHQDVDINDVVQITDDIHWVGFYDKDADLHCNPYLLMDGDEAVLIDPGSIPHFPTVMRKVIDLVNPEVISTVIAQHQDPDVCGSLPVVEEVVGNQDMVIAAHSNCIWLIRHYGLRSRLYAVDKNSNTITLKSGRKLKFIFTPHLHSPGAIATWDEQTGTLFTSDIFGGISPEWHLYASDGYLPAMAAWHQAVMPANGLLRKCMERFEKLPIKRILPQHGSIIEGERIPEAIDFLKTLPMLPDEENAGA